MNLIIKETSINDAKAICDFKYESPYDVYNFASYEECKKRGYTIANDELRKVTYKSIYLNDELFGFYNIMDKGDHIELGLGIAPKYVGLGYGVDFVKLGIRYIKQNYCQKVVTLTVRKWNVRATKVYEKAGFIVVDNNYISSYSNEPSLLMKIEI